MQNTIYKRSLARHGEIPRIRPNERYREGERARDIVRQKECPTSPALDAWHAGDLGHERDREERERKGRKEREESGENGEGGDRERREKEREREGREEKERERETERLIKRLKWIS
eukprot:367361-Amorphochlora_amoeboformis.AAC.1